MNGPTPDDPVAIQPMPLVPGARSFLLNGLMQSDLDANGNKIWNLDTSNLNLGGGPLNFPAQPHKWLNSYSANNRIFTATQPATADLSDFPPQAPGDYAKFLMANGAGGLSWGAQQFQFLNVKQPPFNAMGDGVHDDFAAINAAITVASEAGGLTVYFPAGTYYISQNLAPTSFVSMLGDNPFASIIKANRLIGGAIINLKAGSIVRNLGFDGDTNNAHPGPPSTEAPPEIPPADQLPTRVGIFVNGQNEIRLENCICFYINGPGIFFQYSYQSMIRNCSVAACGSFGIGVYYCPETLIENNLVELCNQSGILAANSQGCTITGNQVYSCGQWQEGIGLGDSDNSTITGNLVQQCGVGIVLAITGSRATTGNILQSYGLNCTGNNVVRNYVGGILIQYAHGSVVTGNVIADNAQGGTDNATVTGEPGFMVTSPNGSGSGYQVGDIVTVQGGSGVVTPATAIVTYVLTGGKVPPDGLMPLSYGFYATAFPPNPVSFTGGHGTGLSAVFTTAEIAAAGTGYNVGQVLVATLGTFTQPLRLMITKINSNGGVAAFQITCGGSYTGTPPVTLSFVTDALSPIGGNVNGGFPAGPDNPDLPDASSGFLLSVNWGKRYSILHNGETGYGIATYHLVVGGVIGNNVISHQLYGVPGYNGVAYLNIGTLSPLDRAVLLTFTGNNTINNRYSFRGQVPGQPLDTNYNPPFNSVPGIFANNLIYPPSTDTSEETDV